MVGIDMNIWLLEFHGEGLKDPEKHLFICENIWEDQQITHEETKLAHLEIAFRNCALD
jgi:hypothetical protein